MTRCFILLLLAACAEADYPPTFYGAYGESVYANGYDVVEGSFNREIQRIVDAWEVPFTDEKIYCDRVELLNSLVVRFREWPFVKPSGKVVYGTFSPGNTIQVAFHENLEVSSLGHEIGHFFLFHCVGKSPENWAHPAFDWWYDVYNVPF